jgi:hypothetical protein
MRIRQVRPEFFADPVMASLSPLVRLTYIGLWCVADDAGWLTWDVAQIGAQLFPFESSRRRERELGVALERLADAKRVVLHPCNCLLIPHLVDHQKIGGNKNLSSWSKHRVHTDMDVSAGKVSNVRVGYLKSAREGELTEFRLKVPRPA